jgi:hypothetical protein
MEALKGWTEHWLNKYYAFEDLLFNMSEVLKNTFLVIETVMFVDTLILEA